MQMLGGRGDGGDAEFSSDSAPAQAAPVQAAPTGDFGDIPF